MEVEKPQPVRETTPSLLNPVIEKRIIRMRSPSPGFRGRSMTPIRGRSMTPLQRYREKSATPSAWRSITPFISREEKEKTPFEIGPNIIQQLASYKAIIDKALVMDISMEEEPPAKYILSEHSVIDRAAVMDLSNVEIIYVEDDDIEESDYRESESPASVTDEREKTAEPTTSDDEAGGEKKKKPKKGKKVVKKKEKKEKEKEDTPPRLKLDLDPPKPKVNKAKLFEQNQKAAEEKPLDKPPPKKKGGNLTGALAAMKAEEAKLKEAEEQKKQIEEKMKRMKAEQEAKKAKLAEEKAAAAAADQENEQGSDDERGSEDGSDAGSRSRSGSGSRSGSESGSGSGSEAEEEEEEAGEEEEDENEEGVEAYSSSEDDFTRPNPEDDALWTTLTEEQQGIIRSKYERKKHKKLTERERDLEWQKAREAARLPRIHSHLKDVTVEEGHNVKLTCTVTGPELNIKWYKDGNPIEKSPRVRILVNEGILSLELLRSLPTDSGEYTCSLKNNNGDASTSAILTVYEVIKDDPTPPTFTVARG